jgi:hypothetical protein
MLKIILIALAVIIVAFVIVVALQPKEFRVARSATMSAPPSAVFAQVNDFHKWQPWNPWGKIDPAMKQTYEGGEGRMTITESRPSELIGVKLEFFKPFAATNTAEFTFKPEGNQTAVTWSMFGEKNFMAKAIHLFISMDKMIGGQFEKGLADMKAVAEAQPKS